MDNGPKTDEEEKDEMRHRITEILKDDPRFVVIDNLPNSPVRPGQGDAYESDRTPIKIERAVPE